MIIYVLERVHMGSQVPAHASKSLHGGNVPTFKPPKAIKVWLIVIEVGSLFYEKNEWNLSWEFGVSFAQPNSQPILNLTFKKRCHLNIHVILGTKNLRLVWSGKSQLPCSQRLTNAWIDLKWLGTHVNGPRALLLLKWSPYFARWIGSKRSSSVLWYFTSA